MLPMLVVTAGLLVQAPARTPEPVRVWRADSTAYVALRRPGHLLVMHVDAIGRIQVLYPLTPDDTFSVATGAPTAIPLPPTAEGSPATFLAVWSRWPFDFSAVRWGSWWDYENAWLLQPTAGDPLAALLEIADRVTDGRPYDYAEATYAKNGALLERGPVVPPDVCWTCVRPRPTVVAAAAPAQTHSVDCTNATLTNSFCGVATGSVSITSVPAAPRAQPQPPVPPPAPVYVPYYLPIFVYDTRPDFDEPRTPTPPPPPPSGPAAPSFAGAAFPVAPRLIVPSPAQIRSIANRHP